MLRAAEDRPGATSAELATVSGVQGGSLHALLAHPVKSGEESDASDRTNRLRTRSDAARSLSRLALF